MNNEKKKFGFQNSNQTSDEFLYQEQRKKSSEICRM